jgi:ABC-type sugar transport system ATPase subunit
MGIETGDLALRVEGLTKSFGARSVLRDVSLEVRRGEMHGLVGANGSGKSTLVKILTGYYRPTELRGPLLIDGREVDLPITKAALNEAGVRIVHQGLGLIDELDAVDNVCLGSGYVCTRVGRISRTRSRSLAQEAFAILGGNFPLDAPVGTLPAWQRVVVGLARALAGDVDHVKLLILDEVTASMASEQVNQLIVVLDRLKLHDAAVLYVTHRLREIFLLADTVTVLRDGAVIATRTVGETNEEELIEAITGRLVTVEQDSGSRVGPRMTTSGLALRGLSGKVVTDVTLDIAPGEIVGVTGRVGCGKSELARLVAGIEKPRSGYVGFPDRLNRSGIKGRIQRGMAFIPPDRARSALLVNASVRENLSLPSVRSLGRWWFLSMGRDRRFAEKLVAEYNIVPRSVDASISILSGGNQQKVVVARWLSQSPGIIILDEPTEGVDVQARQDIYWHIRHAAMSGSAVLVASSSAEEIVELCHRVVLLNEGRIVKTFDEMDEISVDILNVNLANERGVR